MFDQLVSLLCTVAPKQNPAVFLLTENRPLLYHVILILVHVCDIWCVGEHGGVACCGLIKFGSNTFWTWRQAQLFSSQFDRLVNRKTQLWHGWCCVLLCPCAFLCLSFCHQTCVINKGSKRSGDCLLSCGKCMGQIFFLKEKQNKQKTDNR